MATAEDRNIELEDRVEDSSEHTDWDIDDGFDKVNVDEPAEDEKLISPSHRTPDQVGSAFLGDDASKLEDKFESIDISRTIGHHQPTGIQTMTEQLGNYQAYKEATQHAREKKRSQFPIVNGNPVDLSAYMNERKRVLSIFRRADDEVKARHALKASLGRRGYDRFYRRTVFAAIRSANDRCLISVDTVKKCSEMVARNWRSIPVYERELNVQSRNSRLNQKLDNEGGLYVVDIFLPDGTKLVNFAKRYAKRDLFEKAVKIQDYLGNLKIPSARQEADRFDKGPTENKPLGMVATPEYTDDVKMLVAEQFFDGKTLNDKIADDPDNSDKYLIEAFQNWALLSAKATNSVENSGGPDSIRTASGGKVLGQIDFKQSFITRVLAAGSEFRGMNKKKASEKIMEDEDLSKLVELYDQEVSGNLDAAENMFCHGDFHLDNIIFTQDGVKFIDWEGPNWTVPQYDLYRLIRRLDVTPEEEKRLVGAAFEALYTAKYEYNKLQAAQGHFNLGEDEEGRKIQNELVEKRVAQSEEIEEAKERFWQNYKRCRVHMDLDRTVKDLHKARGGKKHCEDSLTYAAASFRRAMDTIENEELKMRLALAGQRLFGEECEEIGKDVEYLTRRNHTMQSAGTYTVMHLEDAFLRGERRKRKVRTGLKIGIPTLATILLSLFAGATEVDRRDLAELERVDREHYSKLVRIEEREEPVKIELSEGVHYSATEYPEVFDPTISEARREDNLDPEHFNMQKATSARARIYIGPEHPDCRSGFSNLQAVACSRRAHPIQAYDHRFPNVDGDMVKALILTSEWMNSRGLYGRWGTRDWQIGAQQCNSPIIFYNAEDTSLINCQQIMDPQNNILYTFSRLNELLSEEDAQLEDAIAKLFLGEQYVLQHQEWAGETDYYRYATYLNPQGDLNFPREARDFVGGFMQIYERIKQDDRI